MYIIPISRGLPENFVLINTKHGYICTVLFVQRGSHVVIKPKYPGLNNISIRIEDAGTKSLILSTRCLVLDTIRQVLGCSSKDDRTHVDIGRTTERCRYLVWTKGAIIWAGPVSPVSVNAQPYDM